MKQQQQQQSKAQATQSKAKQKQTQSKSNSKSKSKGQTNWLDTVLFVLMLLCGISIVIVSGCADSINKSKSKVIVRIIVVIIRYQ